MRQNEEVPKVPKLLVEDETEQWRLYELEDKIPSYGKYLKVYHRHDDGWIQQLVTMPVCARCRAEAPEAMGGFKKLLEWEK